MSSASSPTTLGDLGKLRLQWLSALVSGLSIGGDASAIDALLRRDLAEKTSFGFNL